MTADRFGAAGPRKPLPAARRAAVPAAIAAPRTATWPPAVDVGRGPGASVPSSPLSSPPERRRRRLRLSLRVRITGVALLVIGLVMTVASVGLVQVLEVSLLRQIDDSLAADAEGVAEVVRAGNAPRNGLPERYVQFASESGTLIGSNEAADGMPFLQGPGPVSEPTRTRYETITDPELGRLRMIVRPYDDAGTVVLIVARPINQLTDTTQWLTRLLLGGAPLLTAAMALVIWLMVGRSLRPVESVRTAVSDISARDLSGRVPSPGTGDEIDRLTSTVNEMLARLEASVTSEQRFVADASHELRSPIAGMRALLETGPDAEGVTAADRSAILAALNRLQSLADQLLDLAAGDGGGLPRYRPVDLDEIVLRRAASLDRPGLLVGTSGVSGGQVLGDAGELTRLVENLATNAARHARTSVRFSVTEDGSSVVLVVLDDGPGIAPADRARVFERFTRLDDARSRDVGGAGLGLAIAARIVERHRGSIVVDEAPGGGARFTVRLPASLS